MSRTLGIDLSTNARTTGFCLVEWGKRTARASFPGGAYSTSRLVELIAEAKGAWVAVDAPFGWPQRFVESITEWQANAIWPRANSAELRYRLTDRLLQARGYNPLSVTSDWIAATARHASMLLTEMSKNSGQPVDRVNGPIVEAYPLVALNEWSLRHDRSKSFRNGNPRSPSYKEAKGSQERIRIISDLRSRTSLRIEISDSDIERCHDRDHELDALICALVARAASKKLTVLPNEEPLTPAERGTVPIEGWIHRPREGSLEDLT